MRFIVGVLLLAALSGCATKYGPSSEVVWTRSDIPYEARSQLFPADMAMCQAEAAKVAAGSAGGSNIAYSSSGPQNSVNLADAYTQAAIINSMRAQSSMQAQIVHATIRGCMYERGWHQVTKSRTAWDNCIDDNWPVGDSGMTAFIRAGEKGKCDRYPSSLNTGN